MRQFIAMRPGPRAGNPVPTQAPSWDGEGVPELPPGAARWLERFPRLRRWPHSVSVHFPIVFLWSTTFFTLLYLLTGEPSFEATAFHCLGGGVLSTPPAILTGLATRRFNFPDDPRGTLALERRLSWLLLALALTAFIWRWKVPGVLADLRGVNLLYLGLVLAATPLVTVISFFGGMLTYTLEPAPGPGPHLE